VETVRSEVNAFDRWSESYPAEYYSIASSALTVQMRLPA
jgi:hypothetical protein